MTGIELDLTRMPGEIRVGDVVTVTSDRNDPQWCGHLFRRGDRVQVMRIAGGFYRCSDAGHTWNLRRYEIRWSPEPITKAQLADAIRALAALVETL